MTCHFQTVPSPQYSRDVVTTSSHVPVNHASAVTVCVTTLTTVVTGPTRSTAITTSIGVPSSIPLVDGHRRKALITLTGQGIEVLLARI